MQVNRNFNFPPKVYSNENNRRWQPTPHTSLNKLAPLKIK